MSEYASRSPCARPIAVGAGASFCGLGDSPIWPTDTRGVCDRSRRCTEVASKRNDRGNELARGVGARKTADSQVDGDLRVDHRLFRKGERARVVARYRFGIRKRWNVVYACVTMRHGSPLQSRVGVRSLEAQSSILGGRRLVGCTTRSGICEPLVPSGQLSPRFERARAVPRWRFRAVLLR